MYMLRLPVLLLLFCLSQSVEAQTILSRVTFPIDDQQTLRDLARTGLDLTHGFASDRSSFTTDVQDFQLKRFDQLGIRYAITIPDLNVYRKELQNTHQRENFLECQDHGFDQEVPKNFEFGSLGGYMSSSEVLDQLDIMAWLYPDLISVRKPIGNFKTWRNNSLYVIKISDHPEIDEDEPEILYTGLHHAREFISVSQ